MGFLKKQVLGLTMCFALCAELTGYEISTASLFNLKTNLDNIYACPRCRRIQPKGPKKRPTPPGYKNKDARK